MERRGFKAVCRTAQRRIRVTEPARPDPPGVAPTPPWPGPAPPQPGPAPPDPDPRPRAEPVIAAAGDVARCDRVADEATARLVDDLKPDAVAVLGDAVDDWGTAADFDCYDASWGRHNPRTRPTAGNHEYYTDNANPYWDYFGDAAGERGKGWYSYDLGAWHIVVLNSNCDVLPCGTNSEQANWLRADLAAHPRDCTLAYMHHPLTTSSTTSSLPVWPLWEILVDNGVELVLSGHAQTYERFARQDAGGNLKADGTRQFVVGTGGHDLHAWAATPAPNSEVRDNATHGVLKLTLKHGSYGWRFVPVAGRSFTDSGTDSCV
jgi:hypothetical protein